MAGVVQRLLALFGKGIFPRRHLVALFLVQFAHAVSFQLNGWQGIKSEARYAAWTA
jgi:hypothetical protein